MKQFFEIMLTVVIVVCLVFGIIFAWQDGQRQLRDGKWKDGHHYIKLDVRSWAHDPDCPCQKNNQP
jgi:hypothetical protein